LPGGSQPTAGANNLCLPDDVESYVRAECETNAETSDVEVPRLDDGDGTRLERESSGTEPHQPSDVSVLIHDEGSSQMEADDVVDRNKSSAASEDATDSRSDTKEEVQVGDDTCWNTSGGELHIPPVKSDDRCIRCNKLRPLEQCPVCHCMYPSVAVHIGLHSIRKTHTPSALLPIHPTNQDGVSGPTGLPVEKLSHESDQSLMCTACGEILPSAKALRSHSKTCLKFAVCMVCGTTCENETNLRSHMKLHANPDAVGDTDSVDSFISEKKKHDDFFCAACEIEFGSVELLSEHMDTHVDTDQRICQICGKTFIHTDSLKTHMRSHTGRMPFQCETCGKPCRSRRDLKEHREVHSVEKQHVCTTCGKQFRLRKTYLRHLVIHSGEKNHECEYCGMRFWFNYSRTRHMLVHTGEKPYVCSTCGERFAQWNGLSQHRLRSCRKRMKLQGSHGPD